MWGVWWPRGWLMYWLGWPWGPLVMMVFWVVRSWLSLSSSGGWAGRRRPDRILLWRFSGHATPEGS